MDPCHDEIRPESSRTRPEPTLDGRRLGISELNLGQGGGGGRFNRLLRHVSLFLAGMYTGESCAGTPHGERKSKSAPDRTGQ